MEERAVSVVDLRCQSPDGSVGGALSDRADCDLPLMAVESLSDFGRRRRGFSRISTHLTALPGLRQCRNYNRERIFFSDPNDLFGCSVLTAVFPTNLIPIAGMKEN